jgi:hypothetical protein
LHHLAVLVFLRIDKLQEINLCLTDPMTMNNKQFNNHYNTLKIKSKYLRPLVQLFHPSLHQVIASHLKMRAGATFDWTLFDNSNRRKVDLLS